MAKIPPPKKSAKGVPPPPTKTVGNLDKPASVSAAPLNFKVPSEFRRDFKIYAAQHGKKLNEVLYEAFAALKEKNDR